MLRSWVKTQFYTISMALELHRQLPDILDDKKPMIVVGNKLDLLPPKAKAVHLGDQLESVHAPRARAFEALQLMRHFDEFPSDQPLHSPLFTDPDRLLGSAEMIQKLNSIAQELDRKKFAAVQMRIAHKYDEIERHLIEEFVRSHDRQKLREIAAILSEFKGFSQCLDAFVERMQNSAFRSGNFFDDILALCERANPMLHEIFPSAQQVMQNLLLNVFHGKLQETVLAKLDETEEDPEAYLSSLHELYSKTLKHSLEKFRSDTDQQFLRTLIRSTFGAYLSTYPKTEQKFIDNQCNAVLARFYDSKGHQKKNFLGGGLGELKRVIQVRLLTVETYGGETFLSEEVAINVLQETKNAFARCNILCKPPESIQMAESHFDLLLRYLFKEHADYAVELALAGIPLAEPKTEPPTRFFAVVQQTNAITHLFVKQFDDCTYPLVKDANAEEMVIKRRDATLTHIESQLNKRLQRQINAIVGYLRFLLNTEQKKADFRPEDESRDIATMPNNRAFRSGNVFDGILALCDRAISMLHEIFTIPRQAMQKLLLNAFRGKLQETVLAKLEGTVEDPGACLGSLHAFFVPLLLVGMTPGGPKKNRKEKTPQPEPHYYNRFPVTSASSKGSSKGSKGPKKNKKHKKRATKAKEAEAEAPAPAPAAKKEDAPKKAVKSLYKNERATYEPPPIKYKMEPLSAEEKSLHTARELGPTCGRSPSRSTSRTGRSPSRSTSRTGRSPSRSTSRTGPSPSRSTSRTGRSSSRSTSRTRRSSSRSTSRAERSPSRSTARAVRSETVLDPTWNELARGLKESNLDEDYPRPQYDNSK